MNYTRKRALLACDFCRHRKRKCDGVRPRCSTCEESNADCVYKELPADRVEPANAGAVVERLSRIESLLEEQTLRLDDIARGGQLTPDLSSSFSPGWAAIRPLTVSPHQGTTSPASLPNQPTNAVDCQIRQTQFLIPYDHSTSANSLLSWAGVRSFVPDYPRDYFFNIEERLPLPPSLHLPAPRHTPLPNLDYNVLEAFTQSYFSRVHPTYPLFSPQQFKEWHSYVHEHGPQDTAETAICLAVYALGCLASSDDDDQARRDDLALQLFQHALRVTIHFTIWGLRPTMEICQALLLCASFFAHLGRPLHSWKMALYASQKFMALNDRSLLFPYRSTNIYPNGKAHHDEGYLRVFWSCFMIECDRAAEMDILRSGIEPLADSMPLPRTLLNENEDIIYFVAETAIRRLLNRIHSSLYSSDHAEVNVPAAETACRNNISLQKLLALSSELNRQLEEWYHSIPDRIRPPIGTAHVANDRGKVLRIRYYAARHIIHRPFVLYVALQWKAATASASAMPETTPPLLPIPQVVQEKCEVCVNSCQMYLYNVVDLLDRRSPYLWTFSQSCMACLLVLSIANSSPQLRPYTPDLQPLFALVLPRLSRWATPGSSFEAEVRILESLAHQGTSGDA